jgi:hypothetical protein
MTVDVRVIVSAFPSDATTGLWRVGWLVPVSNCWNGSLLSEGQSPHNEQNQGREVIAAL